MALTDLTRISTAGIATGSTIDSPILRKDVNFRGNQVGVTSVLFDSSEKRLDLKDNVNLTFGDDGDLKLYHNGSHSYIDETGTGNLYIRNGTKNSIWCKTGGQVNLYFNDEKKFETAETGAAVTGILTATSFSGPIVGNTNNSSGISTFYDLRVSNNLTVEGTTTTIDTNLINVDRIEVGANSSTTVAVSVAQTGSADIINLFDGNTEVLTVTDGGNVGIGYTNPDVPLKVNGVIQSSSAFRVAGHPVVSYSSFNLGSGAYATRLGSTGTTTLRHTQIYAGGSHQATFDGVNNRLGIGITNPLRKVDVVGNSLLVRPTIDNISSSGNASAVNNSIIVRMPYGENAASTTNAGARFGIQFTGANNTTDVSSLNFGNDPIKSASIYGVSEDNLGYSRKVGMVFYTSNLDIAQRERLRIASDGKVAMGLTSTSGGKCDPESNHLLIRGASTVGTKSGHIMLTGDSATIDQGPQIVFSESGSGANWAGAYIGHERKGGGSQGDLVFATRRATGDADTIPVEALRITSAGKIEVKGTRSGDLQANDDDSLKLFTKSTTNAINRGAGITFYTHDGSGYEMGGTIQVAKENADADDPKSYMRFSTQNGSTTTERLRIKSGGQTIVKGEDDQDNFMVDVAGTQFAVHTDGTDGEISLRAQDGSGSDNSKYMTFFTHPSGSAAEERIRITSSGDVGIGTASPTEKLDVRGYLVVAEKIAVNRSRIVLSAPDGGNYRHLFGANLKVIDDGTYTTPSQNISGGGWEYLPANSLNSHGKIRYMSAPDTNATSSTPEERLRIDGAGRVLIGLDSSTQSNSYMQVFKKTGDETTITVGNVATSATGMCRVDFCPSNQAVGARIECHATEDFASNANRTADLTFITRKDGTNAEKLRIKSDGKILVGTNNEEAYHNSMISVSANTSKLLELRASGSGTDDTNFVKRWAQSFVRATNESTHDILTLNSTNGNSHVVIEIKMYAVAAVDNQAAIIKAYANAEQDAGGGYNYNQQTPVIEKFVVGTGIAVGSLSWNSGTLRYTTDANHNYVKYNCEITVWAHDRMDITFP